MLYYISFTANHLFFFFQAEDGIRDLTVTGVQTCALPISELIIRRRSSETSVSRDQVLSYAQYLARARLTPPDKGSSAGDAVYVRLAGHFFRPTLVPNTLETERRRDEQRRSVDPSKYIVRAGDRIVGAHEVVTHEVHEKLVALRSELVRHGTATRSSAGGVRGPLLPAAPVGGT